VGKSWYGYTHALTTLVVLRDSPRMLATATIVLNEGSVACDHMFLSDEANHAAVSTWYEVWH
jgi:hypothetical protein